MPVTVVIDAELIAKIVFLERIRLLELAPLLIPTVCPDPALKSCMIVLFVIVSESHGSTRQYTKHGPISSCFIIRQIRNNITIN